MNKDMHSSRKKEGRKERGENKEDERGETKEGTERFKSKGEMD